MRLYAVTDQTWTGKQTLCEQVEAALKGGVTCVQLREKELSEKEFIEEAIAIRKICQFHQVPLIINDNVNVALHSGADGIHKENILKLSGSGIDGVALVSAIFSARDIERECKELSRTIHNMITNEYGRSLHK